jgi:DMSO/TMAO reductase YedYZ molybdopterin-dependent catalytic subunit
MHRIPLLIVVSVLILGSAGCAATAGTIQSTTTAAAVVATTTTSGVTASTVAGELEPIVVPTLPDVVPGYLEVDPATGLHVTAEPVVVDFASYRLEVKGKVAQELSLSYDELRRLPKVTATPVLDCPGYFTDIAAWSGVAIKTILDMAGVQPGAEQITLKAADDFSSTLTLDEALDPENFLAYELMGQPVPVLHGFPLRAVVPSRSGSAWVKWLVEITVK